ncbi:MAG: hypothetical protein SGJ27_29975 [Candidatus Melainabacteria bacterium]|nr:hypothetical protein [Candidatus Melainabacteria bacterium]
MNKNKAQTVIVLSGLAIIVLMGLFPPWTYVDDHKVDHPMGYAPLWKPPSENRTNSADIFGLKLELGAHSRAANSIDLLRLSIQIAIVCAVTSGACFLLKRFAS